MYEVIISVPATRVALLKSIQHWQRMIAAVKHDYSEAKFDFENEIGENEIYNHLISSIDETFSAFHCALCGRFDDDVVLYGKTFECVRRGKARDDSEDEDCPLTLIDQKCLLTGSLYDNVLCCRTVKEWLIYAGDLLEGLFSLYEVPFTTA